MQNRFRHNAVDRNRDGGCSEGRVAVLIQRYGLARAASYTALPGRWVGRNGWVIVQSWQDRIRVGGSAVTGIEGMLKT